MGQGGVSISTIFKASRTVIGSHTHTHTLKFKCLNVRNLFSATRRGNDVAATRKDTLLENRGTAADDSESPTSHTAVHYIHSDT